MVLLQQFAIAFRLRRVYKQKKKNRRKTEVDGIGLPNILIASNVIYGNPQHILRGALQMKIAYLAAANGSKTLLFSKLIPHTLLGVHLLLRGTPSLHISSGEFKRFHISTLLRQRRNHWFFVFVSRNAALDH